MATKGRADGRFELDDVGETILYEGANYSQLCVLFKCDHRTLKAKMHGIDPVGRRRGVDIYDISVVAGKMGKLTDTQVDKAMMRLNQDALPPALRKEYWAGKRAKQEYEIRAGDLWPTTRVIMEVGEMVKSLKMELDLLTDGIERATEMTDRQREVAKGLITGCKMNMLKALKDKFDDAQPITVIDDDDEL